MPKSKGGDKTNSMAQRFGNEIDKCKEGNIVKNCYRKGSLKFHPDKNSHLSTDLRDKAQEKFKELNNYNENCQESDNTQDCYEKGEEIKEPSDGQGGPSMAPSNTRRGPSMAPVATPADLSRFFDNVSNLFPNVPKINLNYGKYMMYAILITVILINAISLKSDGGNTGNYGHNVPKHLNFGGGKKNKKKGGSSHDFLIMIIFLVGLCKIPSVIADNQGKPSNEIHNAITEAVLDTAADAVHATNPNIEDGSTYYQFLLDTVGSLPANFGDLLFTTDTVKSDQLVPTYISENPFPESPYWGSRNYLSINGTNYYLNTLTMENLAQVNGITDTSKLRSLYAESQLSARSAGRLLTAYMLNNADKLTERFSNSNNNLRVRESPPNTSPNTNIYDPNTGVFNVDQLQRDINSHETVLQAVCTYGQYKKDASFAILLGDGEEAKYARLTAMGATIQKEMEDLAKALDIKSNQVTSDVIQYATNRFSACQAAWTHYDIMIAVKGILESHSTISNLTASDINEENANKIMNQLIVGGGVKVMQDFKTVMSNVFNPDDQKQKDILNTLEKRMTQKLTKENKSYQDAFIESLQSGENLVILTAAEAVIIPLSSAVLGFGYSGVARLVSSGAASIISIDIPRTTPRGDPWNILTITDFLLNITFILYIGAKGLSIITSPAIAVADGLTKLRLKEEDHKVKIAEKIKLLEQGIVKDPTQNFFSLLVRGPQYVKIKDLAQQITQGNNPQIDTQGDNNPQITGTATLPPDQRVETFPIVFAHEELTSRIDPSNLVNPSQQSSFFRRMISRMNPLRRNNQQQLLKNVSYDSRQAAATGHLPLLTNPQSEEEERRQAAQGMLELQNVPNRGGKKRSIKKQRKRRKHTKKLNKKNRSKKNKRKKQRTIKRRNKKTARRRH